MANPEHLDILKQGVEVWNRWRKENPEIFPDLDDAKISGRFLDNIDLSRATFINADCRGTRFLNADLWGSLCINTDFSGAQLSQIEASLANFNQATLFGADCYTARFEGADLSKADLEKSYLYRAFFRNTNFTDANLTGALIGATSFDDCDLSTVKGLGSVTHQSPSSIGIDTIYLSKGDIPEIFLKKAGVPEDFIIYANDLVHMAKPIQFHSCFISYTETDNDFSSTLYNDLIKSGVRVWRWRENAPWGKTLRKSVHEALWKYDKLLAVCSKASLKSPPVLEEIEKALNKEDAQIKDGKEGEVLFPITIDDYIFDEWDHYLKDRVLRKTVGDFQNWGTDSGKYRKSIERLVKDLNKHS